MAEDRSLSMQACNLQRMHAECMQEIAAAACAGGIAGDVMAECARGQQAALNGDAGEHSSLQSAAREVCAVKQVPIAACRCHTWAMCPSIPS